LIIGFLASGKLYVSEPASYQVSSNVNAVTFAPVATPSADDMQGRACYFPRPSLAKDGLPL